MQDVYVHIESPGPRPISEEEVHLLLGILSTELTARIENLDERKIASETMS